MFNLIKLVKLSARRAINIWIFKEPQKAGETDTETQSVVYGSQCIVYCIVSEFQYLKPIISKRLHTHTQRFILSDLSKQSAQRLITPRSSPSGPGRLWLGLRLSLSLRLSLIRDLGLRDGETPAQTHEYRIRFLCTTWRLFMKHLA